MADYNLGTARGKITLEADTSGADQASESLDALGRTADVNTRRLDNTLQRTQALQQGLRTVGTGFLIAGGAIVAGFGLAVKTAADFEHQMSAIQAVSGATADEMTQISAAALRIGKDTVFSASEAGLAMEELVKAGISVKDTLNGAADATVALAAAGGVDLPTAATIAANAMNQFGIGAEDLVGVTDSIAGAANASAIDMTQFATSLQQVGAVANLAGANFEDTAVAIAVMGNAGVVGSDAGTSLKTMLLRLNPVTKKASNLMRELGLITADGTNQFYDQNGSLKSLSDVSQILQDSLAGMTDQQKQATLAVIFGQDAIRGAAILAEGGAEAFDSMAAAMSQISAADTAATRMQNLKGSTEQLKGSVETLAIQIGTSLLPMITAIVDWFTRVLDVLIKVNPNVVAIGTALGLSAGFGLLFLGMAGRLASSLLMLRQMLLLATGATALFGEAGLLAAARTKIVAAATKIFNLVLNSNPIVRIVSLVLALVAALITLAGGWDEIIAAFRPAMDALKKAFEPLLPIISKLGETIGQVFGEALKALMPILKTLIDAIFPVLIQIIETLAPILGAVATILAAILGPALEIVGKIFEALSPILTVLLKALQPVIDLLMLVLVPVLDVLVWALELLGDGLKWVAGVLEDFFQQNSDGTSAAGTAWEGFVGWLTDLWNGIVAFLQPTIDAIVGFFTGLWNTATAVWTGIMAVVGAVVAWFQEYVAPLIEAVVNLAAKWFNFLWSTVEWVWGLILAAVQTFLDWWNANVAPVIQAVVDAVVGFFTGLWNTTVSIWNAIAGAIGAGVSTAWKWITDTFGPIVKWFSDTFGPIVDAVKKPIDEAVGFILGIKDTVVDFFANAGKWLLDAGANIINGLVEGIQGALGWLTDVLNGITNLIPEKKGPPEKDKKLLYENGALIMRGLAAGLQSEMGNVLGMLGGMNVSIPASIDAGLLAQTNGGNNGKTVNWNYNAAPGSGQLDGLDEFKRAIKVSKVVVPGWAG